MQSTRSLPVNWTASVKTVFFDLDGTFYSYSDTVHKSLHYVYEQVKQMLQTDPESFLNVYWQIFNAIESNQQEGKRATAALDRKQRFLRVLETLGHPAETRESLAEKMAVHYSEGQVVCISLFPDVIRVLELLHNHYDLGIITEGNPTYQHKKLEHAQIDRYFRHIIISEEIGYHKPDRKLYAQACKKSGTSPSETLLIGDRLDWDLIPAKKTGMRTVWHVEDSRYFRKKQVSEFPVDGLTMSFREIANLLGVHIM